MSASFRKLYTSIIQHMLSKVCRLLEQKTVAIVGSSGKQRSDFVTKSDDDHAQHNLNTLPSLDPVPNYLDARPRARRPRIRAGTGTACLETHSAQALLNCQRLSTCLVCLGHFGTQGALLVRLSAGTGNAGTGDQAT